MDQQQQFGLFVQLTQVQEYLRKVKSPQCIRSIGVLVDFNLEKGEASFRGLPSSSSSALATTNNQTLNAISKADITLLDDFVPRCGDCYQFIADFDQYSQSDLNLRIRIIHRIEKTDHARMIMKVHTEQVWNESNIKVTKPIINLT
ncbi:hypothetical protein MP228_009075 [Amoeboaphelidium protococcarum]|nr:hypothetical protein MP228_009075 [Amoeboaphelidium protococcarum]